MRLTVLAAACAILIASVGSSWASTQSILTKMNAEVQVLTKQLPLCASTKDPRDCTTRLEGARTKVQGFIARVKALKSMNDWEDIKRDARPLVGEIDQIWKDYFQNQETTASKK